MRAPGGCWREGDIQVGSTVGAGATARSVGDAYAIGLGIAVGETAATASISPAVTSAVSGGHVVSTGGGLDVKATSAEYANADAQAAAGGGLVGASGAKAIAIVRPVVDAHIGSNSVVDVAGALVVLANDNPEADASNTVSGGGFVGTAGSLSTVTVTPQVQAYIGSGSQVDAGAVDVRAISRPVKTADVPTYAITGVDASSDTIAVAGHRLQTGDVIEYQSGDA